MIKTDFSLLEQALINLIRNSIEACSNNELIQLIFETPKKNKLRIRIEDEGEGIPNNIMDKIYDPFFTTKETGTGLGLSITKRILDQLNGKIKIESVEYKGTIIEINISNL